LTEETVQPTLEDIEDFSNHVMKYAENNNFSYLSSLAIYCEENGVEPESAKYWISDNLKYKIREECIDSNQLVEQGAKLPF